MIAKSFPERIRFFLAEDVRAETTKPMIIGLFLDDIIVIEIPAEQPDPSKEAPIVLQSITILSSFIRCKGSFEANISLYQPNGTAIFEHQKIDGGVESDQSEGMSNINFIAKFMPFSIFEFGQYRFVIKLDEQEYVYMFGINRRNQ